MARRMSPVLLSIAILLVMYYRGSTGNPKKYFFKAVEGLQQEPFREDSQSMTKNVSKLKKEVNLTSIWASRVIGSNLGNNISQGDQKQFSINPPFTFPQPAFSKSSEDILGSPWVMELQNYLKFAKGKKISLITSTMEHIDLLVNWLVAAYLKVEPPLENVLVVSLDYKLHSIFYRRNISSLYVDSNMVTKSQSLQNHSFTKVLIMRLAVFRLLNHYGYDVSNYDSDAVPLRNLSPLFDKYQNVDIFGGIGKYPDDLYTKWGATFNAGVMHIRSNANTGM